MKHDTNPVSTEVQRLADQLRARRAASLADPNTPPWRRKMLEALQRANETRQREEAQRPTPTRTRRRKPTLAGVARQASKAGVNVARYDVRPDGTISIVTGRPVGDIDMDDTTASPDPKWN
jgi:hypothetical protein